MEQLMQMKEMLIGCVQGQMTHLDSVDTKELGEAIDMIKDLSEAIYYCTITEAMEKKDKESSHETMYYPIMYGDERKEDWMRGRMYYDGNGGNNSSSNGTGTRHYSEREIGPTMRDMREGRSPLSRKNYMESKEMHKDQTTKMHELEKYVQELTSDMVEMIEDASPEERQMLSNKIAALAIKVK